MAKPFEVHFGFLQGFGFSTQLDSAFHPWRKQEDARYQKSDCKPRQDRLINRGRRFEQPEEVTESDFLFLVLKEERQTQEEKCPDENQTNHDDAFPLRFGSGSRRERGNFDGRAWLLLVLASKAADSGPVAVSLILLL